MSGHLYTPSYWDRKVLVKRNPQSKAPDPITSYLSRTGLRMDNSTRLSEAAGHWHPSGCPGFLKCGRGRLPFTWLADANSATYMTAGECRLMVEKVQEWFNPHDFKQLPTRSATDPHWDQFYRFRIESYAYLGAFFCLLSGMFDSFSIEAALVIGLELPLRVVDFNRLIKEAKRSCGSGGTRPYDPALRPLARSVVGMLRGTGCERGWYAQFMAYRNMFAHRQSVLTFINKEGKLVQQGFFTYLGRNPAARPVLLGGASRTHADDEQEVQRYKRRHFLAQPVTEYIPALFNRSVKVLDGGYGALLRVYEDRKSGKLRYITDYDEMLPAKWRSTRIAFVGFRPG